MLRLSCSCLECWTREISIRGLNPNPTWQLASLFATCNATTSSPSLSEGTGQEGLKTVTCVWESPSLAFRRVSVAVSLGHMNGKRTSKTNPPLFSLFLKEVYAFHTLRLKHLNIDYFPVLLLLSGILCLMKFTHIQLWTWTSACETAVKTHLFKTYYCYC